MVLRTSVAVVVVLVLWACADSDTASLVVRSTPAEFSSSSVGIVAALDGGCVVATQGPEDIRTIVLLPSSAAIVDGAIVFRDRRFEFGDLWQVPGSLLETEDEAEGHVDDVAAVRACEGDRFWLADDITGSSVFGDHAADAGLNWLNNTGLNQTDRDVWAARMERVCAEGATKELAAEFIEEDTPLSVRAEGLGAVSVQEAVDSILNSARPICPELFE